MKLKISSLRLRDFRSFQDARIDLEDTTILVGANNVGKTNVLDGLSLLAPERPFNLATDLRRHSQASTPVLEFRLTSQEPLSLPLHGHTFPKEFLVVKTASSWEVTGTDGSDILPTPATKYFRNTGEQIVINGIPIPPSSLVSDTTFPSISSGMTSLVEIGQAEARNEVQQRALDLIKTVLPTIPEKWKAAETDFIAEDNPISTILVDKHLPISLLLARALVNDPSIGDYQAVLQKGIGAEVHTLCTRLTRSVNDLFRQNWRFKPSIQLTIAPAGPSLKLYFDQGATGVIEPTFTSDGVRWLVSFFIRLGMTDLTDQVLLLDQPGDMLYPGGQKDLVRLIEQLGTRNQVIYTTHSPFMISKSRLGRNVRVISKPTDEKGNQTGSSEVTNEILETDIRQSELLTEALGFYWTDFVPVGEFNVLMEGKLDAAVVTNTERQKAKDKGATQIDFNRIVVRGVRGASVIDPEAKKLKADGKGVLGVFDGDWKQSTPNLGKHEKLTLPEIDPTWMDIEDLFPSDYISEAITAAKNDLHLELSYDAAAMAGPGSGKKLRAYFVSKDEELGRKGLRDDFELRLVDQIQAHVDAGTRLPETFYKLNGAILKRIT
jgi:hypothetical protein